MLASVAPRVSVARVGVGVGGGGVAHLVCPGAEGSWRGTPTLCALGAQEKCLPEEAEGERTP